MWPKILGPFSNSRHEIVLWISPQLERFIHCVKVYRLNILGKWKTEEVRAEILLLQVTTAQERKIKALLKSAIIQKYAKTFTNHRVVTGEWIKLKECRSSSWKLTLNNYKLWLIWIMCSIGTVLQYSLEIDGASTWLTSRAEKQLGLQSTTEQ